MSGNVLVGGLMGLVSCWLSSSLISMTIAAVLGGIGVELVGSFYGTVTPPDQVGTVLFTQLILLLPMTAILIMGTIGATAFYPAEGQQRIKEMNDLVQAGLRATTTADWPPALTNYAEAFRQHATPRYTLHCCGSL